MTRAMEGDDGKYDDDDDEEEETERCTRAPRRRRRRASVVAFVRIIIIITNLTSYNSKKHTGTEFIFQTKLFQPTNRASSRRHTSTTEPETTTTMTAMETGTTTPATEAADPRIAWANRMRLAVTRPDALREDGSIDQSFFKPKRVVFEGASKKWGAVEKDKLYAGIAKYGIGEWGQIKEKLLPEWDTLNLRVKASRLMGTQSLARYPKGWKGDKAAVDAEYEKHKKVGEATGCWKNGTLVEDDHGSAGKYMQENGLL